MGIDLVHRRYDLVLHDEVHEPVGVEVAHADGGQRRHSLAAEVEVLGKREHDPRDAHVPDGAAQQDGVVFRDRGRHVDDAGPRILFLLAHVPLNRRIVAIRIRLHRLDLEHVAAESLADHPRHDLGVADIEHLPPAVEVVLPSPREEGEQHPGTVDTRPGVRGVAAHRRARAPGRP